MTQVHSPLTGSTNVVLEREIRCSFIIKNYRKQLDVDVGRFFRNVESIQIYRCLDTGFRFYYPFNIDGDSKFYEALQKHSWYYMDWKWEHAVANALIHKGDKVLEIGCARGGFMEKMQQKGTKCVGLESNESASKDGRSKGLQILNQSIEDHARENLEHYDVVCSFQVVEHIAAVKEFMQASIDALKPGGKLVVSVPNNDSLIVRLHPDIVTNMPPHHMGLWDISSLISIQKVFGIELKRIEIEPLQPYHSGFAQEPLLKDLTLKASQKYGPLGRMIVNMVGRRFMAYSVSKLSDYIIGHTILVQYDKVGRI
jgi:2-polyprenyl-3-methyl-5-hydroxy-6-metoxy-1,4-benzoquinol methylase